MTNNTFLKCFEVVRAVLFLKFYYQLLITINIMTMVEVKVDGQGFE